MQITVLKTILKFIFSRNVQITSNGVASRKKSTGNTKQNGGVVCYSSYLDVFQNQRRRELTFASSTFLDVILRVTYLLLLSHSAGMTVMICSLRRRNYLCIVVPPLSDSV